jgi:hypothetical protein
MRRAVWPKPSRISPISDCGISRGITLKRSEGAWDGAKAGCTTPSGRPSNSRPGWKSWTKTFVPSAWIASTRRAKGDAVVGGSHQQGFRVARRLVHAHDLDDDEPGAAPRPGPLIGDQRVRRQARLGQVGVMPGREDAVADLGGLDA